MADTVTSLVELAVGAACLGAGAGAWRRPGLKLVGGLLIAAGIAALVHAIVDLA